MEKYYVLERFSLMKSSVLSAIDSMTVKRKAIEKTKRVITFQRRVNCIRSLKRQREIS